MASLQTGMLKWSGMLLLAGGIIFWIGAGYPPYRQWMTTNTEEYLQIIARFKTNWYIIHGLFLVGIILSIFGMQLFASTLQVAGISTPLAMIGNTAFFLGAVFWIINIAFRLTVTVSVADALATTGQLPEWFQTWMDWSNLLFALFMILSYFCVGCIGWAMLRGQFAPTWVSWFCTIFGFAGTIFYLTGLPVFAPPLMVYLPAIIIGLTIVLKKDRLLAA